MKVIKKIVKAIAVAFIVLLMAVILLTMCTDDPSPRKMEQTKKEAVKNGEGDEIGEFVYLAMHVEDAKEMSGKEFADFCKKQAERNCPEDCMRFVIDFKNGYGISFASGDIQLGQYGKLDDEKMISETIGIIVLNEDGYSYKESN